MFRKYLIAKKATTMNIAIKKIENIVVNGMPNNCPLFFIKT
jgi:hypothetical protein